MKHLIKPLLLITGIVIGLLLPKCDSEHKQQLTDLIMKELVNKELKSNKSNEQLTKKIETIYKYNDSINSSKPVLLAKWKQKYPEAVTMVDNSNCDSISKANIMVAIDSLNYACREVINNDSIQINNLRSIIALKDTMLINDSTIIDANKQINKAQSDELASTKKQLKRQKLKTIGVAILAGIAGALILLN